MEIRELQHNLRNPYGKSENEMRATKLEAADLLERLAQTNEYLHRILAEKVSAHSPNLWIVIIVRNGERFNAEFNNKEQAEAVYNAEIQLNSPAVLYECVATKTFIPVEEL